MRSGIWAAPLAVIALIPAGCGSDDDSGSAGSTTATAAAEQVDPEQVSVGLLAARVRGHHAAALERYDAGERDAALEQAELAAEVKLAGAAQSLEKALSGVAAAIEERAPATEVRDRVREAAAQTEAVEDAARRSAAYTGSVVAELAGVAAHEYEESVQGGNVAHADEYLEGYGFLQEAQRLYRSIEDSVREKSAAEADEIDEAFEQLDRAMPSGDPPARPVPAEEVEQAAKLIGAELEETVGAQVAESDPQEVGARIERLLDQIARTYDPAAPDPAAELAAEAYLENYEVIEAGVIEAAPDINAALEPLLGAELRKQIREGASQAEVEAMVNRAKALLQRALRALESSG